MQGLELIGWRRLANLLGLLGRNEIPKIRKHLFGAFPERVTMHRKAYTPVSSSKNRLLAQGAFRK
jgi:hypothetical protein